MTHKLLLADDSVTIQRVIELTFADEDMTVVSVGDGQQAIDRIPQERPDLVLVDVDMPQQNGYQVARFVKNQPDTAHIPVLLLTGAFEPIDEAKARAAGCDGVLSKPFEPQMLIARVKELLAGRAPRLRPQVSPEEVLPEVLGFAGAAGPSPGGTATPVGADAARSAGEGPEARAAGGADETPAVPLDEYFDRLDAAFENLAGRIESTASVPEPGEEKSQAAFGEGEKLAAWMGDVAEPRVEVDLSAWMPQEPGATGGTVDLTEALEEPEADAPGAEAAEADAAGDKTTEAATPGDGAQVETARPEADEAALPLAASAPPHAGALPEVPLSEAFCAFLAAEHGVPVPPALASALAVPLVMDEQTLEAVTRRIVHELGGETLRTTVADAVSRAAERVVREEIERLRSTLG